MALPHSHSHSLARTLVVSLVLALGASGCASEEPAGSDGPTESDVVSTQQARRNGLRARLQKDFANAPSMKGFTLVFTVTEEKGDATKVFMRGAVRKRDAQGRESDLTPQNWKESAQKAAYEAGPFFDPIYTIALQKKGTQWVTMTKNGKESYFINGTPAMYSYWYGDFGIPDAWMGLEL